MRTPIQTAPLDPASVPAQAPPQGVLASGSCESICANQDTAYAYSLCMQSCQSFGWADEE